MNATRARFGAIALIVTMAWTLASAQQRGPGAEPTSAGQDLAGIQRSLDRLVELLEVHLEHQRVDLLLKRIQLKERRLEPSERRLRDAEGELEGLQSEIAQMKRMLEEQQEVVDDMIRDGSDQPDSDERRMIADIERAIRSLEAQADERQVRLRRIEDDLAAQREEIEILDDMLLEMLD
jgi:chromosome segregation ATPase